MKYAISTLGCKVNQFDSFALESFLARYGITPADEGNADVIIVNTCAVTAESERKSRQAVRKLKSEHPRAAVVVCGCSAQVSPAAAEALGAQLVWGSGDREGLAAAIAELLGGSEVKGELDDPFARREIERLPAGAFEGRTRAYVRIQDGCSNFCTYCIIPYARGRARSLPVTEAAAQAGELCAAGFREIVVTGIEISSYGKDLPGRPTLADVVRAMSEAAPEARLRLGSLEPRVITPELCRALAEIGSVCPHFHLSLQSGSDGVLKRMGRKYNTEQFYGAVCLLREHFPDCALTADLITGFPAETEAEHRETLDFISRCGFSRMHIFPYSVRPGTKAAEMPQQVEKSVKERRAAEARSVAAAMQERYHLSRVGKMETVLFEVQKDGFWYGHAANYCPVRTSGDAIRGKFYDVLIKNADKDTLSGNIV
ncbi:MAG: tRNA (N(6)-L-threonylcarbamoyladenosine(37)-C(2))-methylthiotransferase MtaB [Oscillospiraceae bacterium]|nr:tRNA (N(6)-L-threonylcarbamoyladenosine(37)-C(2))-methylthiotransferase MtaB [Oscillospiraceae bacterium]